LGKGKIGKTRIGWQWCDNNKQAAPVAHDRKTGAALTMTPNLRRYTMKPANLSPPSRKLQDILNDFSRPIYKIKALSELFFIEGADDEKILDANVANGVSSMLCDLAGAFQNLVEEIRALPKIRQQQIEELQREKAALKAECAVQNPS
jgi:hypothetical protein